MGANGTTDLGIAGGGTRRRARIEDENGRARLDLSKSDLPKSDLPKGDLPK